jgi:hypothetical protein
MGVRFLRGGKPGRAPSIAAWRAASTGSWPWKGVVVSKSWKMIMAKLYTSTFRLYGSCLQQKMVMLMWSVDKRPGEKSAQEYRRQQILYHVWCSQQ